jgi:hypothetical protein
MRVKEAKARELESLKAKLDWAQGVYEKKLLFKYGMRQFKSIHTKLKNKNQVADNKRDLLLLKIHYGKLKMAVLFS